MHASELVDLAALVALEGRSLVESSPQLDENALHTYWSASRCRLDRWGRALRSATGDQDDPDRPTGEVGELGELWEEIIVSEVPTRIVAAFLVAHDLWHRREEAGPIGRNVLYGHIDARRRVVQQMAAARRQSFSATECRELHTRSARWSDVLLAYLMPLAEVDEFAFDVARAREFAYDASEHGSTTEHGQVAAAFLRTSLRLALQPVHGAEGYSGDLNAQIACGLAGCFQSEKFASFGHVDSGWLHRIQRVTDDTITMVENLIAAE